MLDSDLEMYISLSVAKDNSPIWVPRAKRPERPPCPPCATQLGERRKEATAKPGCQIQGSELILCTGNVVSMTSSCCWNVFRVACVAICLSTATAQVGNDRLVAALGGY